MKTLYFVYICDDEVGEVEGMFDTKGNLLDTWTNNDACWRGEYFAGFMRKIGYVVKSGCEDEKLIHKLRKAWLP